MKLEEIRQLDPKRVIVLDTETTGLKPNGNDEILSLTIIDLEGTVLFDELVRPEHRKTWAKAQEVNGISPAMVKDKRTLAEYGDRLRELWRRIDLVVGYNVSFDTGFLYASGLGLSPRVEEFDVMREFAPIWGDWDDYHNDYRWVKLVDCAGHYGVGGFDAHSSLGDTEATRKCFLALINDPEYEKQKLAEGRREVRQALAGKVGGVAMGARRLGKVFVWIYAIAIIGACTMLLRGDFGNFLFYLFVVAALTGFAYAMAGKGSKVNKRGKRVRMRR